MTRVSNIDIVADERVRPTVCETPLGNTLIVWGADLSLQITPEQEGELFAVLKARREQGSNVVRLKFRPLPTEADLSRMIRDAKADGVIA